jgi:hypothetical protein
LKAKLSSSTLKNAPAFYNAASYVASDSEVVGSAPQRSLIETTRPMLHIKAESIVPLNDRKSEMSINVQFRFSLNMNANVTEISKIEVALMSSESSDQIDPFSIYLKAQFEHKEKHYFHK